jgi:hypothetical protein
MNFTMSLIYPQPSEEGLKNISVSELVCVVTADQTCSSTFFANLLRFIDSGARHCSDIVWSRLLRFYPGSRYALICTHTVEGVVSICELKRSFLVKA